ncbi:hypothetical protein MHYP_G00274910 [Metynnis hypsauchen]
METSSPWRRRGYRGASVPRRQRGNCKSSSPRPCCGSEVEAKEACDWLRAAGFPQYVQLYEAGLFPIDIASVRRDHEFLDHDSVRAFCRRLTTLNKCAAMSLEVHFQCKQSEDSEEDDACALSSRWAFQRESKTWSRLCTIAPGDGVATLRPSASSDSVLSDFSHDVTSLTSDLSLSSLSLDSTRETTSPGVAASESSDFAQVSSGGGDDDDAINTGSASSPSVGEKPRRTSRLFLRRMESLRRRNREKETVAMGVSTETNFREAGLSLHCTPDASLPGMTTNKRCVAKDATWKSHTICRTNFSQSEAPIKPQRVCLYLEDYQLAWEREKQNGNLFGKERRIVHLPSDHKPGTFPRSLSIESLCPAPLSECSDRIGWPGDDGDFSLGGGSSRSESQDFLAAGFRKRRNSTGSIGSVYDNVPEVSAEEASSTFEEETAFQHLDAILQQVQGLQLNIDKWSLSLEQQLQDHPSSSESESTAETTLPGSLQYEDRSVSDMGMTVGIFRKSGVKSQTFLHIYQFVPECQRLQAVQAAVVILPDENREVLQTLLYFLSDIASAQENQMTADSLAVCLAPSILHLNSSKRDGTSPRLISRKGGAKPDHKDLSENMAATQCLSHMITECKKLFQQIPHEMMLQSRNSYVAADAQPLPLHGFGVNARGERVDYRAYLDDNVQCLIRDAAEKNKGWHSAHGPESTELAYRKVGDVHPIRLWRVSAEVEAPPPVVLQRVLRERHLWDEDLLHSRVIESLENNTEVFHYITDSMAPHPRRDFVVLRRWCTDALRGVCILVSSSVDHDNVPLEAGLRAVLLTSRILIEPCGMGRSRLTHYCRADLRGRSPDWYNKVFGHLCAAEVARIRASFPVLSAKGPETKI